MSCTTILVGKYAANDHSTMIARTDDGHFDVKNMIVMEPKKQPRKYKSVLSHVEIELPDNPMRYTASPSVDRKEGIWAAIGINEANVGMTATETITSNPRVLSADPLVEYKKAEKRGEKEVIGGIGEEDIVVLVLPYIHSAREGVRRLASLLERYGTYESNGIAFNDADEVWWMETIGGHHWMAKRVPDDVVAVNPNQFGMDTFDIDDAFGRQEAHMCSADLREFIAENHLDLNQYHDASHDAVVHGIINPRNIFGSRREMDHVYNTPRAWFMGRYLTPYSHRWDGQDAEYNPESDNIPWSFVPDRKVAVEDVEYMLGGHFQGTIYDPYSHYDSGRRGKYRSIGINRTGVTSICQIRSNVPEAIRSIEWICFGSTTFSAFLPVYTNVRKLPGYLGNVTLEVSTENLYWASRLIGAMADHDYPACIQHIERYKLAVASKGRNIVREYDKLIGDKLSGVQGGSLPEGAHDSSQPEDARYGSQPEDARYSSQPEDARYGSRPEDARYGSQPEDARYGSRPGDVSSDCTVLDDIFALTEEANIKLCKMAKEQTIKVLGSVLHESTVSMKNGFKLADN